MNSGNSLNFDAQGLQNAQEEEFRQEEEQQQNELKQLLANAFDDLIDEDDDEFSITSDEGTASSANVSLQLRAKEDSDRAEREYAADAWSQEAFSKSTPIVSSLPPVFSSQQNGTSSLRTSQENPLRSSQELPVRGSYDAHLRNSQDKPLSSSQEHLLRSSQEMPQRSSQDMPLRSSQDVPLRSLQDIPLRSSQDMPIRISQEMALRSSQDMPLRSSQDLPLRNIQEFPVRGSQDLHRPLHDFNQSVGTNDGFQSDGYHSNSEQGSMTPTYPQNINPQAFDWISRTGNSQQEVMSQPQVHNMHMYEGYQAQNEPDHIPSHCAPLPERQETEGGNVQQNKYLPHYEHVAHPGYYNATYTVEDQPRAATFEVHSNMPHSEGYQLGVTENQQNYYVPASQLPETQQAYEHSQIPRLQLSPRKPDLQEDYKVQYRGQREKTESDEEETYSSRKERRKLIDENDDESGVSDPRQYAQLQVLYKARGRKLEDMTNEYEILKQETAREIRILKHQLSVAKGESEGSSSSLKQVQDLLAETKGDNSQLAGKLKATEVEVEALKRGKQETLKKLQTAESTIETLNHQLLELGNSESLSRARHEHEVVVTGLQQKYEKEIKVLNEKIEGLNTKMNEMNLENTSLRQKLAESYKSAELAHISRADTINKLTRSLEDSQKQCQTLLESTSSQELSQMKVTLQQALASRKITDDLCQTYQEEIKDLKEQVSMLESASALGVLSGHHPTSSYQSAAGYDDSLLELGIKKTLDFDCSDLGSSQSQENLQFTNTVPDDTVTALKAELERCLLSNKQKRVQVAQLQEEVRTLRKESDDLKTRCEQAEKLAEEYRKSGLSPRSNSTKNLEWEDLTRAGDRQSAVETRLKKDIHNLRREREALTEDVEDLKKRLEETAANEENLTEMNQNLKRQISQMVKDFDEDKREALDRLQKTCDSVHQVAKEQLREELQNQAEEEQSAAMEKYEQDCTKLRNELNSTIRELDRVKELYVKVCEEKDKVEDKVRVTVEASFAQKLEQLKSELKKEKEDALAEIQEELGTKEGVLRTTLREQIKKEFEEENKRIVETKVAMAKVEWFEEQRQAKQAAVDNAVRLSEAEWKVKLDNALETQVEQHVEEAKTEWLAQKRMSFDTELQQQLQKQQDELQEAFSTKLQQQIQQEKEEWQKATEEQIKHAVHQEHSKVTTKAELDLEMAMSQEQEKWRKKMDNEVKQKIAEAKEIWEEVNETETLKKLEEALEEARKVWEDNAQAEVIQKLIEAQKDWETSSEVEFLKKLNDEKEKWNVRKVYELQERLEEEKSNWRKAEECRLQESLQQAKDKWKAEFIDRLKEEKEKWKQAMQIEKTEEVRKVLDQAQRDWDESHDASVEQIKISMEEDIQGRISAEVSLALDDAKREWNKEHETEISANLSAAEFTQNVLKEEIEKLKVEISHLQTESRQKEEQWQKERQDLIRNKDTERKNVVSEIHEQYEKDYQKFTADHHDTLTQALKSAREQHNKEKMELESRYSEELKKVKDTESHLQELLRQASLSESDSCTNKYIEKERELWENEKWRLQQEVDERDALLEKADLHLSQEVDKLRSELESAYQRRLEAELMSMKQQYELESSRDEISRESLTHLETEIKNLKDQNKILVSENQNVMTENECMRKESKKLEIEAQAVRESHDLVQQDHLKLKEEVQMLKVKLTEDEESYIKEIQNLNAKKVQQAQKIAELEAKETEVTFLKSTCEELQEKNEQYEKDKTELMESVKLLQEDIQSLKEDTAQYQKRIRDQETQLKTWQDEVENRQVQVDQLHTEVESYRQELERSEEKLNKYQTDVERHKTEIDRYKSRFDRQQTDLEKYNAEIEHHQSEVQELHREVDKVKEERDKLSNNIHCLESAYRKDLSTQKQKQEEVNARLHKAEKSLKEAKQHYRTEMEKVKKSLEMENTVAMETMKNKMVEMQKGHLLAMESLRKQYKSELSDVANKVKEQKKKDLNSTEVQTDSEDQDDDGFMELREQYLETVGKIKDDVMKHITETNLRAAETVRCEMMQERNTTLQELKRIYMENVRKILQNEILEANIEAKLADIEQALEVISFDAPGSRSVTPGSSRSSTPTPRNDQNSKHNESISSVNTSINTSVNRNISSQPSHNNVIEQDNGSESKDLQKRPQSAGRTHSSMLPPKDTKIPSAFRPRRERSSMKGVTFSKQLEDRHNRAKSLPGERTSVLGADRFVTFRSPSPDFPSSGDNSDSEYYSHRLSDKSNLQDSAQPSRIEKEFPAFDPRTSQSSHELLRQSPLYKTVSEPELAKQQTNNKDFVLSTYKYTSLRDGLRKSSHNSYSPTKDSSISQEDLRSLSGFADRKSYSVEVGLQGLGLERTSPRRFNPSPERLSASMSHDAGESPLGTPRVHSRSRSHRPVSHSDVIDLDDLRFGSWDTGQKTYGYRHKKPVKNLVEKFSKMGSETMDSRSNYVHTNYK